MGLSCKKAAYLEHYLSLYVEKVSRSICHGRKQRQKQKNLPRTNTEFHGKDRSRDTEKRKGRSRRINTELHGITRKNTEISRIRISHGRKTYLSEPDA